MHSSSTSFRSSAEDQALSPLRTRGIVYCHKLMHQGLTYGDARRLAAVIAKFEVAGRTPNARQRQLIMQYSVQICRAHLWCSKLLLEC
ncbi:MAG: hypothetical protein AAFU71_07890 [Cyanobacteria bacterium J06632_22]